MVKATATMPVWARVKVRAEIFSLLTFALTHP
jgi:hypothetical protein